jgi:hypothetical protein
MNNSANINQRRTFPVQDLKGGDVIESRVGNQEVFDVSPAGHGYWTLRTIRSNGNVESYRMRTGFELVVVR